MRHFPNFSVAFSGDVRVRDCAETIRLLLLMYGVIAETGYRAAGIKYVLDPTRGKSCKHVHLFFRLRYIFAWDNATLD
jgi:hypothetical protein